ncbi:hypothetical protein CHISP_3406 [Chitinispirillum alkaliphilum]|nr:hypothetical protein CHISP_3406 [Chitinispirillum alkaliphilum]
MLSFCGWGTCLEPWPGMLKIQGTNILLNMFFGPVVNASRGITYQLSARTNEFVMNFSRAINPQITKYYTLNQKQKMFSLVTRGSKFAFFLLFFISMPLLLKLHSFLHSGSAIFPSMWFCSPGL